MNNLGSSILLPTSYCPPISYFYLLFHHDNATICLNETFEKQTYRNRCEIVNANGLQNLTIPVNKLDGHITKTGLIEISYAEDWQKKHWRSIESSYRRTPYFEYYEDELNQIIFSNYKKLYELNIDLIQFFIAKIGLKVEVKIDNELDLPIDQKKYALPKNKEAFLTAKYFQPFSDKFDFFNNLSILDLLFLEGPNSIAILQESKFSAV